MSDQNKDKKTSRTSGKNTAGKSAPEKSAAGKTASGKSASEKSAAGKSAAKRVQRQGASRRANKNGVLIILLTIIVIAAVIGGVIYNFRNRPAASGSSSSEPTISVEANTSLEHNKYPEINELISNYRKAILEEDTELLKKVYNTDIDINAKILEGSSSIIESYNSTQYYTKPGLAAGEYVAYVYDDLKLRDISTPAPNLSVFYIKSAEDGSKYIYRGEYNASSGTFVLDEQTQNYIQSLYSDSDVTELIASVNKKMESACGKDKDLAAFVEQIRNRAGTEIETEIPTEQASETEKASETEAATETETETETEAETPE